MGKFGAGQQSSDDEGGMEVEQQPTVKKPARKKKIIKLKEKEGRAMAVQRKVERKEKKHDGQIRPLLVARDEKKLKVFNELKKKRLQSTPIKQPKMSKGKRRRLEKKQRVEFRKSLTDQLTERKQLPLSMSELGAELNNIPTTVPVGAKPRAPTLVQRSKTANEQVERMRQILNYSQFQKNPLGSIKAHLLTSLKLKK